MKKFFKMEFILIALTGIIVGVMVLFNDVLIHVRLKELKVFLQQSNIHDNNLDHMALVMKYKLHKRLYEKKMSKAEADRIELRVHSLLQSEHIYNKTELSRYGFAAKPVLYIVNGIRYLLGKESIKDLSEKASNKYLQAAYYYERNKFYEKALEIYNKAVRVTSSYDKNYSAILLHQAFCHAILGNYKQAQMLYSAIIKDYPRQPVAVTSVVLLRYLEGFRTEKIRVMKQKKDTLNKVDNLYNLIAYNESLKVLKKIEKSVGKNEQNRVSYYKARCYEELADKNKALKEYQKICNLNPRSKYARLANKRIFIIGSTIQNGKSLVKLAKRNNQFIQDRQFTVLVKEQKKFKNLFEIKSTTKHKAKNNILKMNQTNTPVVKQSDLKKIIKLESKRKKQVVYKYVKPKVYTRFAFTTNDGNVFVGKLLKETSSVITIQTIIGPVNIKSKDVVHRKGVE